MLRTRCLCGEVGLEVEESPDRLTQCNCSLCRRYGAIWAYFRRPALALLCPEAALTRWRRPGEAELDFARCATCGCVMFWEGVERRPDHRVGVNMRNIETPDLIADLPIETLDGAETWTILSTGPCPNLWRSPGKTRDEG